MELSRKCVVSIKFNLMEVDWRCGTKTEGIVTRYQVYKVHLVQGPLRRTARHFSTFEFSVCFELNGYKIFYREPPLSFIGFLMDGPKINCIAEFVRH